MATTEKENGYSFDMRFRLRRGFVIAELVKEGEAPVLMAAMRPSLIEERSVRDEYYELVNRLMRGLIVRLSIAKIVELAGGKLPGDGES